MNDQELMALRGRIHEKIAQLEEVLGAAASLAEKHQQQSDDESANLDININAAVETKVLQAKKVELNKLKRKLVWLESEDAGLCDTCGEEIPVARLAAVLGTQLCVSCAENRGD